VVDPEKWVPHDYACVRVDSRGCGVSPGFIDHFSPRETKDFYDCIEWAGVQPWSNGKVGLDGVVKVISTALVDDVQVGDYVVLHVGYALAKIDPEEARRTIELLNAVGTAA